MQNIMKMKSFKYIVGFATALFLTTSLAVAKENIGAKRAANKSLRTSAACVPASSSVELDVNNIRALLHNGGDMWWDLVGNPRYEVPKVDNPPDRRYSSFAGSLWIGGVDETGQLRVAAQTYRQSGNDFWPGPLTENGATVDDVTCEKWDKHYKVTKSEIDAFRSAFAVSQIPGGNPLNLDEHASVKNWPAFGEDSEGNRISLAPFVDVDGDPFNYSPGAGDYPDIAPNPGGGTPDQAVWWVINDKGDVHTETGGEAIGLEIQMLAFAFSTANAINDMTFYKYKVFNRSTLTLNDTYMGQWVDADLGNYADDYVGCDTTRGLGFCYNGNAIDGTASGYGANPPSFGMDFFQGPIGDNGTRLDMTKFVYYENDFSLRGNPEVATHYYGYLRGFWKDGSRMVNNGLNGYPGTAPGPETDFIYYGEVCGTRSGWNEASAGNQPFDRRFLEASGPFTLQPGAINEIITGAVWARGYYDDQFGSVCELKSADDIAQALFDANFQLLDGPDAPDVSIAEYDQELVLSWNYRNPNITNNFNESYLQSDPVLVSQGVPDSLFQFQGYMIFQLRDNTVSANELFDTEKARLVAQCDVKDGISTIVNRTTANAPGLPDPVIVDQIMVTGDNDGIFNSIRVTDDLFASGTDRRLKNYTTYYYGALAYAYNDTASDGRKFVQGNRNFINYPATPHKIDFENFGTVVSTEYGDGIEVTQIAGFGNGGNFVKITPESESTILSNYFSSAITYQGNASPITLEVVNPKEIIAGDYRLEVVRKQFQGQVDTISAPGAAIEVIDSTFAEWVLSESGTPIFTSTYVQRSSRNTGSGVTSYQNRPEPMAGTKRVITGHGFAIGVRDAIAGSDTLENGFIGATAEFAIPQNSWLEGLGDDDNFNTWDWILSGGGDDDRGVDNNPFKVAKIYDPNHNYENALNGTFAPFCLARGFVNGDLNGRISPGVPLGVALNVVDEININQVQDLADVPDVDIVFTADDSKWSECVVIETSPAQNLGSGAWPMSARWKAGVDKSGNPVSATPTEQNQGKSWFPGYAINLNTGERLNIFFGESSWDRLNNGDDLKFNPTSDFGPGGTSAGGRHYVYVSNTRYDGCAAIHDILSNTNISPNPIRNSSMFFTLTDPNTDMRQIYDDVVWVGVPMLNGAFDFDDPHEMPSDVRISLRVSQPFRSRTGTSDIPVFTFNTADYAAQVGVKDVASKSLMENVRVVPNPYYAHSSYESSQIQSIVKITNLPQKCKIRIFTLNGTLVRTYNKDSDEPDQRWDLKNQDGVPVASGVYIIHVDGFDLGETVVKFFGVMPQIDLNAF